MFNLRKDSFPNADPNHLRICQNQSAFANNVKTNSIQRKERSQKERKERKKGKEGKKERKKERKERKKERKKGKKEWKKGKKERKDRVHNGSICGFGRLRHLTAYAYSIFLQILI